MPKIGADRDASGDPILNRGETSSVAQCGGAVGSYQQALLRTPVAMMTEVATNMVLPVLLISCSRKGRL